MFTSVVDFPLRGEWIAPNTPGTKVPSHGTDILGQRYAFDFVGIDAQSRSLRIYRPGLLQYLIFGVRLQYYYGWSRPIYAAAGGTVVQAEDGWPERDPVHVVSDVSLALKNAWTVNAKEKIDLRELTGNFIIVAGREGYAVYAHAQNGSIRVSAGDKVAPGQWLANVGHSGNSTAPHLHFQLMDNADAWLAQGIPCSFRDYEVLRNGTWRKVKNGIPNSSDRIRKL